jgi:signal transduction histidine kinase
MSTENPSTSRIVVEVSDNGIGLEADAVERIFDAFAQADESVAREFGGLGLGLAIAKAVVDAHGGTVRATSAGRGEGTTCIVELPLHPEHGV